MGYPASEGAGQSWVSRVRDVVVLERLDLGVRGRAVDERVAVDHDRPGRHGVAPLALEVAREAGEGRGVARINTVRKSRSSVVTPDSASSSCAPITVRNCWTVEPSAHCLLMV